MNQLYQLLNQSSKNPYQQNSFIETFNKIKTAMNPNLALQQALQNLPGLREAQKLIQENGGNGKEVFYNLARQKGIDPEEVLKQFK